MLLFNILYTHKYFKIIMLLENSKKHSVLKFPSVEIEIINTFSIL
jgi:hypothetical protein